MRLHLSLRIKVKVFVLRPHAPIGLFRAAIGIVAIHLVQRETIGYVQNNSGPLPLAKLSSWPVHRGSKDDNLVLSKAL